MYIDMKMIHPWKCSGSQPKVFGNFLDLQCSVIHSNSICSSSIPSYSLYCCMFVNHCSLLSHSSLECGNSRIFPTRKTESESTQSFAFMNLITSSTFTRGNLHHEEVSQLYSVTPEISKCCSRINFWVTSNNLCTVGFLSVFLTECRFSEKSFPRKMAACIVELMNNSPNYKKFVNSFHLISWMTIKYWSQSRVHSFFESNWCGRKNVVFFCCLQINVSGRILNDKFTRTCFSILHLVDSSSLCDLWEPLHGFSIPNFSLGSIWQQLFLHHSSCVLFDIAWEQLGGLKRLMLNRHRRWFHSSRVKFPLFRMYACWVLVSTHMIWILGPSWFCRTTNQAQLFGFWKHVSLLDFCLWWPSWSQLGCLQRCTTYLPYDKNSRLRKQNRQWKDFLWKLVSYSENSIASATRQ